MVGMSVPAAAAATTCHDTSAGDIKHGLIVRSGRVCTFSGTVTGGVIVEPGAALYINNSHVEGQVAVGSGGAFFSGYSHLTDSVHPHHALDVFVYDSIIDGSIVGSMAAGVDNFGTFYLRTSTLHGRIALTQGGPLDVNVNTLLSDATVEGGATFISIGAYVLESTIKQQLTFDGPALADHPSAVCGSTVQGAVTVRHSAGPAGVGSGSICEQEQSALTLTVHGSVYVNDNLGRVHVAGSIDGDIICHGNAHHPTEQPTKRLFTTLGGHGLGQCVHYPYA